MDTITDDGTPDITARIDDALDHHWDEVARQIAQREIDRDGDLLETDVELRRWIEERRARRAAEVR